MRRFIAVAGLAALGCADPAPTSTGQGDRSLTPSFSTGGDQTAPVVVFNTQLRAENEPNNSSQSEAKGHAQVKVFADRIEFTIIINNIKSDETFHRAHIHKGAVGVNGPIHWDFLEQGNPVASIGGQPATLRGEARARVAANRDDLLENPHLYYVNVHSTAFPGGAVRGQLR